jgi:F-type H+-transporting ATPase subunit b
MHFDWATFALQTVNFVILVWLLHRFLYKPVLRMVDTRRGEIEAQYAQASAAEAKTKAELAAIETQRTGIVTERDALLKAAAEHAEAAAKDRATRAEADAAALLEQARKTLAKEHDTALAEARDAALDLGLTIARRLLVETPEEIRAGAWLDRIARHLTDLPKPELDELCREIDRDGSLRVVTASALPAETQQTWTARLRGPLGGGATIHFDTDPALIAGAELHFPNAVMRFSWASELAAIRDEVQAHAIGR